LGRFSVRGVQKHHQNIFAKSPRRTLFPKKIDKYFDVRFYLVIYGVSRVFEFMNTTKNVLQKNRIEKFLQKSTKKSKTVFFSISFLSRFWAFLGEGSLKTRKNLEKNQTSPGTFLASEEPTNHVKARRFVYWRRLCGCHVHGAPPGHQQLAAGSSFAS
jgi:hypothetical protein